MSRLEYSWWDSALCGRQKLLGTAARIRAVRVQSFQIDFHEFRAKAAADGASKEVLEAHLDRGQLRPSLDAVRLPDGFHILADDAVRKDFRKGYEVLSIERDHIIQFMVAKYIKYESELVPWLADTPLELLFWRWRRACGGTSFLWLESEFDDPRPLKARLI